MSSKMIQRIWNSGNKSADAIVPIINKRSNPVCAFYNNRIQSDIKKELEKDNLKVLDLLQLINTNYVQIDENQKEFTNMNTRNDLEGIINKS
jgi:molybdopterin-guanine dinucleotide biosynthesis protein A|tara:strand:+ start:376 stop:651 length:276 start_codon:yes stop_codon:yes gene_type:complete